MKVSFDKLMSAINTYIDRDLMPVTKAMGSSNAHHSGVWVFVFMEVSSVGNVLFYLIETVA